MKKSSKLLLISHKNSGNCELASQLPGLDNSILVTEKYHIYAKLEFHKWFKEWGAKGEWYSERRAFNDGEKEFMFFAG